jgi:hypothetical protein
MTIPPTMITMEADWFCFGCWLSFLLMLVALHTQLLTWFFSRLMRLVWLGGKLVLGCSVWWNWSFPKLPFSLTTALPYLIRPKRLIIKALKYLNHHTKLRLLTR